MMNLFELSSFQQYLYSPRSWLHKITSNIKCFSIFVYLFLLFYSSVNLLILINLYLIIIPVTLSIPIKLISRLYNNLIIYYSIVLIVFVSIDNSHDLHLVRNDLTILSTKYYLKYLINKNTLLRTKSYRIIIQIHILLPLYIIRFLLIIISSFTFYKLLLLTTYNKDILLFYGRYFFYGISQTWKNILFILILSSERIYLFEMQIKNFYTAFQLRDMKFILLRDYLIVFKVSAIGINILIQLIFIDTLSTVQTIYAREIFSEKQTIWLIK
jgi:hypothetical protein